MPLYLVQHGRCLPKAEDPEQGLSIKGRDETSLIANVAKNYNVQVGRIFHSGKKRARQTAEIFSEIIIASHGIAKLDGLKPLDDVVGIATTLKPETQTMIVGHLPFMEKLVSQLLTGASIHRIFAFQNSGIVCLDREEGITTWHIKWSFMPNILS